MNWIDYRCFGSPVGTSIVLLHGIGSSKDCWESVARYMPGVHLLAWDMPGYGASPALNVGWPDADDYACALADWLDQLGLGRCTLVGHSLGALIAVRFSRRFQERIQRLVLASPALGHRVRPPNLSSGAEQRLCAFSAQGARGFAERRAPQLLYAPTVGSLSQVIDEMARLKPEGHTAAVRLLSAGDLLADVKHLSVPTHVIVGAEDIITPPDNARACHDAVPSGYRGTYTALANAGHALAIESPEAFAQALHYHNQEAFS